MTDTPTRLPAHDRMWIPVLDARVGDMIPHLGEIMHIELLPGTVRMQLRWSGTQTVGLARDAELWIDRLPKR